MRRFSLLMALILLCVMAPAVQAEQATDTTIYWSQWQTEYTDALAHLLSEYEAQHPGVRFEIDMNGGDSVYKTLLAAGQFPDMIMTVGGASTQNWKEYLVPLTGQPCWENLTDYSKVWLTIDGEGYGVPVTMLSYGFIYNVELFEKAGITETPKTWSELLKVVDQLEAAGITPFSSMFGAVWWMGHFSTELVWDNIRAKGELDWEDCLAKLNNEEMTFADLAEYWDVFFDALDLISAHDVYADADTLSGDWDRAIADLATGNAAMLYMGEFILPDVYKANPDAKVDVFGTVFSDNPEDYRLSADINCAWNVTKGKNADVCIDVLNWMCTNETAIDILSNEFGIIPPYKDAAYTRNTPIGLTTIAALDSGKAQNWIFNAFSRAQMENIYADVQSYLIGDIDRAETLDLMYEMWLDNR